MNYRKLREEPLKNAVRDDYFKAYKYTQIGNIDFVIAKHNTERGMRDLFEDVCSLNEVEMSDLKSILWAEAKLWLLKVKGHFIFLSPTASHLKKSMEL